MRERMASSSYFAALAHERFQPDDLLKQAVEAEQAGFDGIACSDHLAPWWTDSTAPTSLGQRLGLARRGRAGDDARDARPGRDGGRPPLQPRRRRAADRDARAPRSRARLPRRRLRRGDERGAGGHGVAVARRAARAHRGGARRSSRGSSTARPSTSTAASSGRSGAVLYSRPERRPPVYLSAFHEGAAELAGRLADGLWTLGDPEKAPDAVQTYKAGGRGGRPRARRDPDPGRLLVRGVRRAGARGGAGVEGDDGRRALHGRRSRPGGDLPSTARRRSPTSCSRSR